MRLQELTAAEAVQLLIRIASLREQTELVDFLKTPMGKARVQAVEHLAGGNPRIYVIFAEFLSRESLEELVQPFMALLDALTPYYQSRMQYLSAQQREIVEFLCDRKFPATVKDIAQRCFITSQTTSSQLKELKEKGYVNVESIGRESFYALQEPLMRICLGMKKERDSTLKFMVDFLRAWYSKSELDTLLQQISDGFMQEYLELALQESNNAEKDPRIAICWEQMRDCFDRGLFEEAFEHTQKLTTIRGAAVDWIQHAFVLSASGQLKEALTSCDRALTIESKNYLFWCVNSVLLCKFGSYDLAIASVEKAIGINPTNEIVWSTHGFCLSESGRHDEAIISIEKAVKIDPTGFHTMTVQAELLLAANFWNKGFVMLKDILNRFQQSNKSYPGDIGTVLNGLLTQDSSQWKTKITDLISWFESFPTAVTNGLVSACKKLISPLISDTTATLWHDTWHENHTPLT